MSTDFRVVKLDADLAKYLRWVSLATGKDPYNARYHGFFVEVKTEKRPNSSLEDTYIEMLATDGRRMHQAIVPITPNLENSNSFETGAWRIEGMSRNYVILCPHVFADYGVDKLYNIIKETTAPEKGLAVPDGAKKVVALAEFDPRYIVDAMSLKKCGTARIWLRGTVAEITYASPVLRTVQGKNRLFRAIVMPMMGGTDNPTGQRLFEVEVKAEAKDGGI